MKKATRIRVVMSLVLTLMALWPPSLPSGGMLNIKHAKSIPLRPIQVNRANLDPVMSPPQLGIEPKVIEQRDRSGKVQARLRITPGISVDEFQFEVEAFEMGAFKQRILSRARGTGRISGTEALVEVVESRGGTRLGFRAEVDRDGSAETRITLSLDRLSFNLIVDEKARALISELQKLIASDASDDEFIRLARELDNALQIKTGYRPFIEQVRNSAAFDILTRVRSLITTVSPEEVKRNPALAVILDASRFLAPSVYPRTSVDATKVTRNGQIIKVGYSGTTPHEGLRHRIHNSNLDPLQCVYNCNQQWQTCDSSCTQGGLIEIGCKAWCVILWVLCVADCLF